MKLVIRGAEWQTRSEEKAWVNLKTGESSGLPPELSFEEARRNGSGWSLAFHCTDTEKMTFGKPLFSDVYDEYGTEYHSGGMPTVENEHFDENEISTYDELIEIPDYPYDEVWFSPEWKESWTPEKGLTVKVR